MIINGSNLMENSLHARIRELEAELEHERTLRRASTAGPGPKPGSWKSQFLAVVARAEKAEARVAELAEWQRVHISADPKLVQKLHDDAEARELEEC